MADFLEQYGAGDERRGKIIKRVVISLAAGLVVAGLLFYGFHTFRQERQAKRFFELVAAHDYKQAYALWGCTDANPCRDYPMTSFLQDWGPQAISGSRFEVLNGESCGSGVIVDVDAGAAGDSTFDSSSTGRGDEEPEDTDAGGPDDMTLGLEPPCEDADQDTDDPHRGGIHALESDERAYAPESPDWRCFFGPGHQPALRADGSVYCATCHPLTVAAPDRHESAPGWAG